MNDENKENDKIVVIMVKLTNMVNLIATCEEFEYNDFKYNDGGSLQIKHAHYFAAQRVNDDGHPDQEGRHVTPVIEPFREFGDNSNIFAEVNINRSMILDCYIAKEDLSDSFLRGIGEKKIVSPSNDSKIVLQ